ncbi:ureidoglycolate lyase [Leptolyngbya sp. FACHB-36]|uniref:ureidoglycolate lyase n=1 Tax=Leptolyngbya sp. FACHB-36 TaxID=2692808 RepID=UPI001680F883|nr:ureidoglycolate lyase [Leptolyngbya sp. FACHB-36]MBD2019410.1 ureidoglycolate lyase [Leptolyngbya sp. FACHB-36]
MSITPSLNLLKVQAITSENFQRYGQVIWAIEDGKSYSLEDAQLDLSQGIPRFYVMRLHNRGRTFHRITRHLSCTQCLGAMEGKEWLIAVAPPKNLDDPQAKPFIEEIEAFRIPGDCFIKLHVGTWHAGPYFDAECIDFYNLELSDTNIVDHHTCDLKRTYNASLHLSETIS